VTSNTACLLWCGDAVHARVGFQNGLSSRALELAPARGADYELSWREINGESANYCSMSYRNDGWPHGPHITAKDDDALYSIPGTEMSSPFGIVSEKEYSNACHLKGTYHLWH
jgi:hypothetical protein